MQFLLSHSGVRRVIGVAAIVFFLCFCIFPCMTPPAQAGVIAMDLIVTGIIALLAAWGINFTSSNASQADIVSSVSQLLNDYTGDLAAAALAVPQAGVLKLNTAMQAAAKWVADKLVGDGLSATNNVVLNVQRTGYELADGSLFTLPIYATYSGGFRLPDYTFANGVTFTSLVVTQTWNRALGWSVKSPNASSEFNRLIASLPLRASAYFYSYYWVTLDPDDGCLYFNGSDYGFDTPAARSKFTTAEDFYPTFESFMSAASLEQSISGFDFISKVYDQINIPLSISNSDVYTTVTIPDEAAFTDAEQAAVQIIGSVVSSTSIGSVASDSAPAVDLSGVAADVGIIAGVLAPDLSESADDYKVADLKNVFPFCIPFDIYRFFSVLEATREAPAFDYPFTLPADLGGTYELEIDLSDFDTVATVLRTMELLAFCVGLAFVTRKLIRG